MSAASPLRASIRPGKGGLKSTDRSHIKERKPGTVESSLDLDTAYTELHPTSTKKRWDYVLGIQDRNAMQSNHLENSIANVLILRGPRFPIALVLPIL